MRETTINELFEKDALEITDQEVRAVGDFMRERRHLWAREEAEKNQKGKRQTRRSAGAPEASADVKLSLDDLDVDLGDLDE